MSIEIYTKCFTCKENNKVLMKEPIYKEIETIKGSIFVAIGKCSICAGNISRILSKIQQHQLEERIIFTKEKSKSKVISKK